MRALALAKISFGPVDIPVRVYASVESSDEIHLKFLHASCNSRLTQQYACPKCDEVVPRDEMIKGYEVERDRFVPITAEELDELEQVSDQKMAIVAFYDAATGISVAQIERCYFVGPDKGADEKYAIFTRALLETRRTAMAMYSTRGRTHLVALAPAGDGRLLMMQLRPADEVRDIEDVVDLEEVDIKPEGVRLMKLFIERFEPPRGFDAELFKDDWKERLQDLIAAKLKAKDIVAAPTEDRPEPVVDFVEALKASTKPARKRGARGATASQK